MVPMLRDDYGVSVLLREEKNSDVSRAVGLVYYERERRSDGKFIDFTGKPEIYAGYLEAIGFEDASEHRQFLNSAAMSTHSLLADSVAKDVTPVDVEVRLDRGKQRLWRSAHPGNGRNHRA